MSVVSGGGGSGGGVVTLIADTLLTVDTANFDLTGIPATYKHLHVVLQVRATGAVAAALVQWRANADSAANYNYQYASWVNGAGNTSAFSAQTSGSFGDCPGASATAGFAASIEAIIPNYAATTFAKVAKSGSAYPAPARQMIGAHWANTAAINRLTIFPSSGSWLAGSRCTLYGLS